MWLDFRKKLPNFVHKTPRYIGDKGIGQQLRQAHQGLEEDHKQEPEQVDDNLLMTKMINLK